MSKVKIRFWHLDRKEYVESFVTQYLVNENGGVTSLSHSGGGRWSKDGRDNSHIEPHYYKNGERIDE